MTVASIKSNPIICSYQHYYRHIVILKKKSQQTKKTSYFKPYVKMLPEGQIWVHYSKMLLYWWESVWRKRQGGLGV